MEIQNTKSLNQTAISTQKTSSSKTGINSSFTKELESVSKTDEAENEEKEIEKSQKDTEKEAVRDTKEDKDKSVDNAIDGLKDAVDEINKNKDKIEQEQKEKELEVLDNNMNIPDPAEKFNLEFSAGMNMNFNSNGQPFADFVNQQKNIQNKLSANAKDLAEESAILSTMEENIAIANRNMMLKETESVVTVQNEKGIKRVEKNTLLTVDTIVNYNNVIMDKADVEFFVNLVNNGSVDLSEVQNAQKTTQVSKTLADLIAKSMNENKPVRIDFDNDISVIIKINRQGKISADFLPSSQIAEAYLKENLPILRQRFDEKNIDYEELNQRKQKQDTQDNNRKKGQKDE